MREEWFVTPIYFFHYKMKQDTKQLVLGEFDEYINKHTSASQSNALGYQSGNLEHWASIRKVFGSPEILGEINNAFSMDNIRLSVKTIWFNDNWENAYNKTHVHPDSDWSGVYYIEVPEGDCGQLTFYDPRPAAQMAGEEFQQTVKVQPEEGKIVIFPSWLPHGVEPNLTEGRRISVSFNLEAAYSG